VTELPNHQDFFIDWEIFAEARTDLGPAFVRLLGYFREDGAKSVAAIETAMREGNTTALVLPADTLKSEARQFGAEPLADAAEEIEFTARRCIESRRFPDELVETVVKLRRLFTETSALMEREINPLAQRRGGAAERTSGNQSFGRI
jgi:HPt (histidine-containing phosphotransfer) domain-containing protein